MKRFRLSTVMLLIVIAALCLALGVQLNRAARVEAELAARRAEIEQMKWSIQAMRMESDLSR
jgi:hypothetical protein